MRVSTVFLAGIGIMACNSAPFAPVVSLSPEAPTSADDLVVNIDMEAQDLNGDRLTYRYEWSRNGEHIADLTGPTVPAARTQKGDRWTVQVTSQDRKRLGSTHADAVVIGNLPPSVSSASVSPQAPKEGDTLRCEGGGASDPDGDNLMFFTTWFVNGDEVSRASVLHGAQFDEGDRVSCAITPFDGDALGPWARSGEVTVLNTKPELRGVSITPQEPVEGDTILAQAHGVFDADGDPISLRYRWLVDGIEVSTHATLPSTAFHKGQRIQVDVTVVDDDETGETRFSSPVWVQNTAPVATSALLSTQELRTDDLLIARPAGFDADHDPISFEFEWTVNGRVMPVSDRALSGVDHFDRGDQVALRITPFDGEHKGLPLFSQVLTVQNSMPSISDVQIEGVATAESSLRCLPSGWHDADGDAESYRFAWTVSGRTVSTDQELPPGLLSRGERVQCTATPFDGHEAGAPLHAASVLVGNTAPRIATVSLSHTSPREADVVTASMHGAHDIDGDTVLFDYAWTVNGEVVSRMERLDGRFFDAGDAIALEVTPHDGRDRGTPVKSAVIVAGNTPPSLDKLTLWPPEPTTTNYLVALTSLSDVDGHSAKAEFAWTIDGVKHATTSAVLPASAFEKGQEVEVTVTPFDGHDRGIAKSASVTIRNTAPIAPEVGLAKQSTEGESLHCAVIEPSTDADGDALTYEVSWKRNGEAYAGATTVTDHAGDTIPAAVTEAGDRWSCTVTVRDGEANVSAASESADIAADRIEWTEIYHHTLTATPSGARVMDGAWLGQGPRSLYGRTAWVQRSDWNALYIPVPRSETAHEAVEVDVYAPSHAAFRIYALGAHHGYNGAKDYMSLGAKGGEFSVSYGGSYSGHGGSSGIEKVADGIDGYDSATWHTVRVEYNFDDEETIFLVDGVEIYRTLDIPLNDLSDSVVQLRGGYACCSVPADLAWSNLRVFEGE